MFNPFLFFIFGDTLTSNDNPYGVTSGLIFATDQSEMSLLNLYVFTPSKRQELLSHWSICLTMGISKMNEIHDPKRYVVRCWNITQKYQLKRYSKHIILIRLQTKHTNS